MIYVALYLLLGLILFWLFAIGGYCANKRQTGSYGFDWSQALMMLYVMALWPLIAVAAICVTIWMFKGEE